MHKVNSLPSHAQIFYPENTTKETISVTEIGYAEPPAGFDAEVTQKNSTLLQYVISGKGYFNGIPFQAPSLLVMRHNTHAGYTVDSDCHCFSSYWIKCSGNMVPSLLAESGLSVECDIFPIKNIEEIHKVFSLLTCEDNYSGVLDSMFMLSGFYRLLSLNSSVTKASPTKRISPYTRTVLDHIHNNYQTDITEKALASLVNLSTNYMHKVFLSDTGTTPINYLNSYRIKRAKDLLHNTDYSISRIAESVGISGGDYFCRVFEKYSGGISPSTYRKHHVK